MAGKEYKLLFVGSMGAGKTTAIAAVSDIAPVSTDVLNSDRASFDKATTTAAFDYGEVALPDGDRLRLYGTPGQDRFDFMWKLLSRGALGVVVLIDHSRPDPLADLAFYLEAFADMASESRAVIGIGRAGDGEGPSMMEYQTVLQRFELLVPVLSVDVRNKADVLLLLDVLFHQIEAAERGNDDRSGLGVRA